MTKGVFVAKGFSPFIFDVVHNTETVDHSARVGGSTFEKIKGRRIFHSLCITCGIYCWQNHREKDFSWK